ncbi:hypothetical protein AAG906_007840 [Vitis piasezkii]
MKVNPSKENDWILSVNTVMHLGIHQIVVGFSIQNSNQNSQRTRGETRSNLSMRLVDQDKPTKTLSKFVGFLDSNPKTAKVLFGPYYKEDDW